MWENHDPDFEATPCEHSSVAICGQASSPFLNIRCDQRGPSELFFQGTSTRIYQKLPCRPIFQAVMPSTCHPKRPYRTIERGILREDNSQVHQQNSSWIQGTLAWKMSRGNDQRTLKSSTMSLMAWWGRQFLPLGRC